MDGRSTYKQRLLGIGSLCLLCFVYVFGQTRINPFEIKPRLKSMHIVDTFTIVPDTLSNEVSTNQTDAIDSTSLTNDKNNARNTLNPFEVDHIPIRKSAIAKRTENLQNQAKTTNASNGFIFWFLLFACAILAIVVNLKAKALGLISRSIFNENILKLFLREESTKVSSYLILLYIIFIVNLAVFIYLVSAYLGGPKGILTFFYILILVVGVYFVRHLSLSLLGAIFDLSKNTQFYGFTIMIFNHFAGIILIPLNFLIAFGPVGLAKTFLWISIIILSILLLLRTIRGIFIVSEYLTNRFFQIFIYLCAFEIAPMLVFIKTLMNFSK